MNGNVGATQSFAGQRTFPAHYALPIGSPGFVLGQETALQHSFRKDQFTMGSHVASWRSITSNIQAPFLRQQRRRLASAALFVVAALCASENASAQMMYFQPPQAMNDYATTVEEHSVVVNILSNDYRMSAPLAPPSVTIHSFPLYGEIVVSRSTGSVLYIPDPDFDGMDGFTYTVSDTNGRVSNVASVMIGVMEDTWPPVIHNFVAVPSVSGGWTVEGTVADEHPSGIEVTFGGLFSGSTTTLADGSFSFSATLSPGAFGMVTARAVNDDGIASTIAYDYVFNP